MKFNLEICINILFNKHPSTTLSVTVRLSVVPA